MEVQGPSDLSGEIESKPRARGSFLEPTFLTAHIAFDAQVVELLLKSGQPSHVLRYLEEIFELLVAQDLNRTPICIQSLESLLIKHVTCLRELGQEEKIRERIAWLKRVSLWSQLEVGYRARMLRFVDRKKEALDEFEGWAVTGTHDDFSRLEFAWVFYENSKWDACLNLIQTREDAEATLLHALCLENLGSLESAYQKILEANQRANKERDWVLFIHGVLILARILRKLGKREKVLNQLALVREAISSTPDWVRVKVELDSETEALKHRTADLVIDKKRRVLRTREMMSIPVGKQFILVDILEYLASHPDRTVSKKELIERVWQERYLGKPHDNRVYSNLNRLRKMIEPTLEKPTYILATTDGYRLAPKLKVVVKL